MKKKNFYYFLILIIWPISDLGLESQYDRWPLHFVKYSIFKECSLSCRTESTVRPTQVSIGHGPVYSESTGLKLNNKNSARMELVALSDLTSSIIWTRHFLEELGFRMGPITVYHDNMSPIALVQNGKSNRVRTRHTGIV